VEHDEPPPNAVVDRRSSKNNMWFEMMNDV
jgi:hypothetical protein